ncbi:PA2817 family protein [Candidatus Marimicrobium litorale]|uniref:PA2817 family protein n=1 Tax=Candidatus Marimicrobium litorale TaxID=2518991 RepID=UPI00242DD528|nr:PA2817 family protein [Candidatus Marimicrobium litorale]
MNDDQYLKHNLSVLEAFSAALATRTRELPDGHPLHELAREFRALSETQTNLYPQGHTLVARLFNTFNEFAPTFPRSLLWFFGGDCLHYLTDEEISQFQQLDELRLAAAERGEVLDLEQARAANDTLH